VPSFYQDTANSIAPASLQMFSQMQLSYWTRDINSQPLALKDRLSTQDDGQTQTDAEGSMGKSRPGKYPRIGEGLLTFDMDLEQNGKTTDW
jgi:hypothetical protein